MIKNNKALSFVIYCVFSFADLLMIESHVSSPEPVKVDKKDGQWYTHDGVDVQDTQGRKGIPMQDKLFLGCRSVVLNYRL